MALFRITLTFEDANNGTTTRTYSGDFADYAAADTARTAMIDAANALTDAALTKVELTEVDILANVADANSNVFEGAQYTTSLDGKTTLYTSTFPSPIPGVFAGNALVFDSTPANEVDDWINLFEAGGAGWDVSDGDKVDEVLRGKRVFRKSGETNLPT